MTVLVVWWILVTDARDTLNLYFLIIFTTNRSKVFYHDDKILNLTQDGYTFSWVPIGENKQFIFTVLLHPLNDQYASQVRWSLVFCQVSLTVLLGGERLCEKNLTVYFVYSTQTHLSWAGQWLKAGFHNPEPWWASRAIRPASWLVCLHPNRADLVWTLV